MHCSDNGLRLGAKLDTRARWMETSRSGRCCVASVSGMECGFRASNGERLPYPSLAPPVSLSLPALASVTSAPLHLSTAYSQTFHQSESCFPRGRALHCSSRVETRCLGTTPHDLCLNLCLDPRSQASVSFHHDFCKLT
jgi:hypothetical protein